MDINQIMAWSVIVLAYLFILSPIFFSYPEEYFLGVKTGAMLLLFFSCFAAVVSAIFWAVAVIFHAA